MSLSDKIKGLFKSGGTSDKEDLIKDPTEDMSESSYYDEETSLLNENVNDSYLGNEGETTLLGHNGMLDDYSDGLSQVYNSTVYMDNDSSEYETTLLTHTPVFEYERTGDNEFSENQLWLVNSKTGEKIRVGITPFTIGKEHSNFLVIDNDTVSRKHAVITYESGVYYVTDSHSTNGTVIEGITLQPDERAEIENGYMIAFGSESFQAFMERG